MDPVSIVGLIASIGSVTHIVISSINRLSSFRAKYREAPFIITSLLGQLCTVRTALWELRSWSKKHLSSDPRYEELSRQVGDSLACFTTLVTHLQNHLDMHDEEEIAGITMKKRISFLWKERDLQGFFQMLDCQVNAMTLLLQAIQCNTLAEQRQLLDATDSKVIIRCAQDCSTSVRACKDGMSSRKFLSVSTDDVDIRPISKIFTFDPTLLETRVYSQNYRSHLKRLLPAEQPPVAKQLSLGSGIHAIIYSVGDAPVIDEKTVLRDSYEAPATDLQRERQMSYYTIIDTNRLVKRNQQGKLIEYPISFDGFLPLDSRAAVIGNSRVYAAHIRTEPWRDWFSSIVNDPKLPLKDCSFATALGWVAEEFSLARASKQKPVKRYFPSKGTRSGYLHLDLMLLATGSSIHGSMISLSVRLVDVTEYDKPGSPQDKQFLLVRIPRVVIRWSSTKIVDCYDG